MKVEVTRRVLVKPCNPTPSHLRKYKISMVDELNPSLYMFRILYFPSSCVDEVLNMENQYVDYSLKGEYPTQILSHFYFPSSSHVNMDAVDCSSLEGSLAQVLPLFYPLAGRYNRNHHYIDCNDQGAEFSEARVDCRLSQLIGADSELLNHLLPREICAVDDPTDPILAIRINRLECGGLAMAVCAAQRIFDSASLGIFLTAWANASIRGPLIIRPDFDIATHFPSQNLPPIEFQVSRTRDRSIVSKIFRFDKNTIANLRETLAPEWKSAGIDRPPSKVVVVGAVLAQALLRADTAKHGRQRASQILQAINVRGRTVPPVSEHACGTWASLTCLEFDERGSHAEWGGLPALASKLRESTIQGVKDSARILSDKEFGKRVLVDLYIDSADKGDGPDYKVVWLSDWTKFGDYELDFGFGKPVWVSVCDIPQKDLFILINTKDNEGIEAWACLHKSDMTIFEQDEYIRRLTTPTPTPSSKM